MDDGLASPQPTVQCVTNNTTDMYAFTLKFALTRTVVIFPKTPGTFELQQLETPRRLLRMSDCV